MYMAASELGLEFKITTLVGSQIYISITLVPEYFLVITILYKYFPSHFNRLRTIYNLFRPQV
jgi:hypothetical protein